MDCSSEEQLVRMALDGVPGVREVHVDLMARTVTVAHDGVLPMVDAALDGLGFGSTHLGQAEAVPVSDDEAERRGLWIALGINASMLIIEVIVGLLIGSLGLLADGLDMGADAGVYAVALLAVGASATRKLELARWSGWLQLALAAVGLLEVTRRFVGEAAPPEPRTMAAIAALALVGNAVTLIVLHRIRSDDPHIRASWIFTANDVIVNMLVIAAAGAVALLESSVPDLIAGLVIFLVVANGARRILAMRAS